MGVAKAGHGGRVGVDFGGQLLGLLGLEAGGDLGDDRGLGLQPRHVGIVAHRLEVAPAQHVQLGVADAPAEGHVDAGPHGLLGGQTPAGLVGLTLRGVGSDGIAVGQAPHHPGTDPMGEVPVVDDHPAPALEVHHQC